jgi:hypothetical protein
MTTELANLTAMERRLQNALSASLGHSDAKEKRRIYAEYESVSRRYCDLAAAGDPEALKRLVFLWWYAESEPSHLSGVAVFPADLNQRVAESLTRAVRAGIDEEFHGMLVWYYTVTDWHFEALVPKIASMLRPIVPLNRLADGSTDLGAIDTESERGLMGDYFRSMRHSQAWRKSTM